jgi:hypothetical protein
MSPLQRVDLTTRSDGGGVSAVGAEYSAVDVDQGFRDMVLMISDVADTPVVVCAEGA